MTDPPPTTIDEAIARLRTLSAGPVKKDGVACFARLYLAVTDGVRGTVVGQSYANPAFLTRLDVVFAGLFFDAVDAYVNDPASAPRAWVPLFEARSRRGVDPLQFALAGMNAHINRDLPVALVRTCTELGLEVRDGSPEHDDYLAVNKVLEATEARVKKEFVTGTLGILDRLAHRLGRVDDVVAMWDVERARDAAWVNGEAMWKLRHDADLSADFLATLDRTVGFAGRGLLLPTPGPVSSALRRLRRLL